MPGTNRGVDFAYIKNGDVMAHLERIDGATEIELQSGPDAFLYDFLRMTKGKSVLLLSKSKVSKFLQYKRSVHARTIGSNSGWMTGLIAAPVSFIRIMYWLAKSNPKWLLCGTNREPLWASFIYAVLTGTPLVHSRHNRVSTGAGHFPRRLSVAVDNACIRRLTGIMCHGPYLKEELKAIGVPLLRIHEFDVSLSAFREHAQTGISDVLPQRVGEIIILYSGRIEKLKGVFDLLDAVEPRIRRNENISLLFAGQGSASDTLIERIKNRGLQGQAKLLGRLPHQQLAGLISRCKVVVTPTQTRFAEGRCMVAMESLALGVPVIAPNFGPFPFLIEHEKNGLLFLPDSVEDLAEKIGTLLDDQSLYANLQAGARNTGDLLLKPPLTFGQAALRAFGIEPVLTK